VRSLPLVVSLIAAATGCDLVRDAVAVDAAPPDDSLRAPDGDLVPPVGSATTLDVACWNLEWFPKDTRTTALVADLITSLELDLVIVEEVASVSAWNELLARLPEHDGVLSTHRYTPTEYQKIGFIYRTGLVSVGPPELLFTSQSFDFPRPPMKLHVDAGGLSFDAIGLHLKAGVALEDADRRRAALLTLDGYLRAQVDGGGEDEVIVLGDYNEVITSAEGQAVMAPLLGAPDRYTFRSQAAASAGLASFIPSGKVIDHIVTTAGLAVEIGAVPAVIPPLDAELGQYDAHVSDHLPVVLSIPMPSPSP